MTHDFLCLIETSRASVPLWKTFLPECHVFVEACLDHFVFYFHLQSHERYFQTGILGIASFIQWSNRIYLKLIQLDFLSGGNSCVISRLVQKQLLKMRVMHPSIDDGPSPSSPESST